MSWLCLAELAEEYWGVKCLDGEQYVLLSENYTPQEFFWRGKEPKICRASQFGITLKPFEGKRWCRVVDIVTGGFPCQDISVAGKGAGIKDGTRSGLWGQMARIINEVRPQYAFVENSPAIIRRGLTRVVSDFSEIGYDAKWIILGADDLGFNHKRKRWWCLATNSNSIREQQFQRGEQNQQRWANNQVKNVNTNPNLPKRQRFKQHSMQILRNSNTRISGKVSIQKTRRILQKYRFQNSIKETSELFTRKDIPEPLVRRMVDGNTNRVDILRGLG